MLGSVVKVSTFDDIVSISKTSQASKAATLQSSKHAGAKNNLTQNQDLKSIKVTCYDTIRYDTIGEFNVDSKAEY